MAIAFGLPPIIGGLAGHFLLKERLSVVQTIGI
jgi:hypothetical protein